MNLPDTLPKAEWHPLAPVLPEAQIGRLLRQADGAERYVQWLVAHRQRIAAQSWNKARPLDSDPFTAHFELPHWLEARYAAGLVPRSPETRTAIAEGWSQAPYVQTFGAPLRQAVVDAEVWRRMPEDFQTYLMILLGGNRAAKSELCAFLTVESAVTIPETLVVCVAKSQTSSRETQQQLIWKYLPKAMKLLNGKQDPRGVAKIKYSIAGGFTEELVVLPNGSSIVFRTYNQAPGEIEGWFLGSKRGRAVGFWADEDATTEWIAVGKRRCNYSGSLALWSFTPIDGMTPTIKQFVGEPKTLIDRPAELLDASRVHVPGCRPGHMPFLQEAREPNTVVMYFFSQFNPFGIEREEYRGAQRVRIKESFYAGVCREVHGANSKKIQCIAYGFTEDVAGRKFRNYSTVNVVRVAQLPRTGTLYHFTDPHGSRPYASIWVLVTPGPEYYIVRNFPDEGRFGEWAIPTKRATTENTRAGWDGDVGPAQRPLGWGVADYKAEWLRLEQIQVARPIRERFEWCRQHQIRPATDEELERLVMAHTRYPWHVPTIRQAIQRGADLDGLRETVADRYMDARFCNSQYAAEHGTTCLKWEFEKENRRANGTIIADGMAISEASGKDLQHGYALITDLLSWDREQPFIPHINAPKIYVSEECTQVRWMFENFTGLAGETGACKEWADLVRHMAEANLQYLRPGSTKPKPTGGSYG